MYTIEEIRAMSPEQQADLQRKLGRKLIINRVLVPVALVVGLRLVSNKLASQSYSNH